MYQSTLSPEVKEKLLKRMAWSYSKSTPEIVLKEPKLNYKQILQKTMAEWRIKR